MVDYSWEEIIDILLILGECRRNYRAAAALYGVRYPNRRQPSFQRIHVIERRVRRMNIRRVRRRYDENRMDARAVAVLAMIHMDPHISTRAIQRQLGIPRSTAHRILQSGNYHPYHITLVQALNEDDRRRRVEFCQWASGRPPGFFNYVMFSDEATFRSNGTLNRHNCHYWSTENPRWYRQVDNQHRWTLNVWCGIVNGYIIGPYFFQNTVKKENYLQLIQDKLPRMLENVDLDTRGRMWFQQDGAPPHYALIVRNFLNVSYPRRWIGRGGYIAWPARSPDLTTLDFYLWGFIKDSVYQRPPTTRDDMKRRIQNVCRTIPRHVLLSLESHFQRRIQLCQEVNGANIEQLLR